MRAVSPWALGSRWRSGSSSQGSASGTPSWRTVTMPSCIKELACGDHVLLRSRSGERTWRHCVIISDVKDHASFVVLTPARSIREQDFSTREIGEVLWWDGDELPVKLRHRGGEVYTDGDSALGKFTWEEISQAILQAKEFASKLQGGAAILNALSELEILPFGYDGEPVDGEGWYALLDCGEVRAGQRLYLADTDATVVDDRAIFSLEGRICDAFWSKADSVADVLRDHHTGLLGSDPGDGGGTDDDGARASFYASIHERLQLAGCPVPEPGPSASHLTPTPPAGPPPLDTSLRASGASSSPVVVTGLIPCKILVYPSLCRVPLYSHQRHLLGRLQSPQSWPAALPRQRGGSSRPSFRSSSSSQHGHMWCFRDSLRRSGVGSWTTLSRLAVRLASV